MPFLPPNQQCQSTEGKNVEYYYFFIQQQLLLPFNGLFSRITWVSWCHMHLDESTGENQYDATEIAPTVTWSQGAHEGIAPHMTKSPRVHLK